MSNIITRGFGPSPGGVSGRDGPITQGFGGELAVGAAAEVTNWRWIELARLRSIEGTDPLRLGTVQTVNVVLANLGTPALPHHDNAVMSGGSREVPVAHVSSGNAASYRARAIRRKR